MTDPASNTDAGNRSLHHTQSASEGRPHREEIVRRMLVAIGMDSAEECRRLFGRFKMSLMQANPALTEKVMPVYDLLLSTELPALAAAIENAWIATALSKLSAIELEAWRIVLNSPRINEFVTSARSMAPALIRASQEFLSTHGVDAHERCSERLFASLAERT